MVTSFPISYLFIQEINKKNNKGVNARHYNRVLKKIIELAGDSHSSSQNNTERRCCMLILIEMIARVIKVEIRRDMREMMQSIELPAEHPFISRLCDKFNLIFYDKKESIEYWNTTIATLLSTKFKFDYAKDIPDSFFSPCLIPSSSSSTSSDPMTLKKIIYQFEFPGGILSFS